MPPQAKPGSFRWGTKQPGTGGVSPVRVLLADDHAILRAGLRMLISAQPDMVVVGEAETGVMAVEQAQELNPDVLVLDLTLPDYSGLKALEQIRRRSPKTRVLVLTMHEDPAYLRSVLAAGGAGYVVKRSADAELVTGIRMVARGRTFIDRTLGDDLLQELYGPRPAPETPAPAAWETILSPREQEAFRLLAQGKTNQQVATGLGVGVKTAETYRARIFQKLGFRDRADLIRFALEIGLLNLDRL